MAIFRKTLAGAVGSQAAQEESIEVKQTPGFVALTPPLEFDAKKVQAIVHERLPLRYLFPTHTHEDHTAVLDDLLREFPRAQLRQSTRSALPQYRNRTNDCLQLGSLRITNRETPGHAEDSVNYLVGNWPDAAPHVAIIGDTIFAETMANEFISWPALGAGVRRNNLTLPTETLLCPGHGPLTTVAEEMAHYPFL